MRWQLPLVVSIAVGLGWSVTAQAKGPSSAHYADDAVGVFWFMHISDLHIGSELSPDNTQHLSFGLGEAREVIGPAFTVATGDLVDASPPPLHIPTTGQDQQEWDTYKQAYLAQKLDLAQYIDLPGNHDGYGDDGLTHYLANSLLGTKDKSTYMSWTVNTQVGEYYFFGFNTAGNGSGPSIEKPEVLATEVTDFKAGVQAHSKAELVITLGHHQLSDPKNAAEFTQIVKDADAFYLHGHVHDYSEYLVSDSIVVNQVNSLGKSDQDNIAVGVVDHNAFVYRATSTSKPWPFIVITAPVSMTLRNDGVENPYAYKVCKDRKNNPVRALVFAKTPPTKVTAQIGKLAPVTMKPLASPQQDLWSAHVDTTALSAGPQDVTVTVTTGSETTFETLTSEFIAGPCGELPDAGTGDGGDADGGDSSTDADTGSGGGAGDGGKEGSAGKAGGDGGLTDAGTHHSSDAAPAEVAADESTDGGCSCRSDGGPSSPGWLGIALLAGSATMLRRRGRGRI